MRAIILFALLTILSLRHSVAQIPQKSELATTPLLQPKPARTGAPFDTTGWRFTTRPVAEIVDDKSGEIRFKIVIDEEGVIESVVPVASTVSTQQEALCRRALLQSHFERVGTKRGGATGFYTFKISIR